MHSVFTKRWGLRVWSPELTGACKLLPVFALALVAGCNRGQQKPPAPPPAEVAVITVAAEPVTLTTELPGRTSAFRVAEVRARVSGIVLKRLFTEGTDIKEGQALYEIDPAPYQAAVDSAQANLARAQASAENARVNEVRAQDLFKTNAISRQELDSAIQASAVARADVGVADAAVKTARINLSYTSVTAPISGRIGRSSVTEGAYVQQGAATLLATIQQLDPIYVDLTQSSTDVLRLQRALAQGSLQASGAETTPVKLTLGDGRAYGEEGTLQFTEVSVDPTTSSVTLRALFPNPRRELLPNLFVRARFEEATLPNGILVPQPVVSRNQRGEPTAMVVGAENKVELRVLTADRAIGDKWLVTGGLKVGDQLIVNNLQRIRPGAVVKPVPSTGAPGQPAGPPGGEGAPGPGAAPEGKR